ncbi:hypothetical protein [Lyticum sinuosum]|uniref:Uncharacterized protein n=1 Tax=Lyticum sinuosum TaxID=1332059 RepID=A0AAE5AI01_9RICK|nr:hypothetical protein [Lyticum sinuosum]MDZ5761626.1 hypothetical protein [Lyticum sinuosum]
MTRIALLILLSTLIETNIMAADEFIYKDNEIFQKSVEENINDNERAFNDVYQEEVIRSDNDFNQRKDLIKTERFNNK